MGKNKNFRSRQWFDNPKDPGNTSIYLERIMNYGYTPEELTSGKPIIGIAQTGSDISPCNRVHLKLAERKTFKNTKLQINLALNYGSKYELINAFKKLQKNNKKINEKNLTKYLQTKDIPDPDLLIRTGNTKRLSNFLLWQLAYSEIFFEKKLWPDFTEKDYNKIIDTFRKIKRNYGNI